MRKRFTQTGNSRKKMSEKEKIDILAVDDHVENLLVLEQYINSPKTNLIKATSGNEALGLILKHRFALILLDVQMPDMNGFETAQLIRKNKKSREIPIIFITAINKEEKYIFEGYQSGAVDYLTKPFNPEILCNKIDVFVQLFEQKQLLQTFNDELEKLVEIRTNDLKIAREQAELANITKSRFLTNMSHELMTPLHGIISYSELGKEKSQLDEKHRKYFSAINDSGMKLKSLLTDLLTLSRLQAGQCQFTMVENCIELIVSTICNRLKNEIAEKRIDIRVREISADTIVQCDNSYIGLLFSHLLSNAVKYSNRAGTISLSFREAEIRAGNTEVASLEISITDQGVGIPSKELEWIFGSFNESSLTASKAGGKGIGLSICREIVNAHQGTIWAEPLESGTSFKVRLPYRLQLPS